MIRKYSGIIIMVLILAVMILIVIYSPKVYDWTVTFSHEDNQPFGCALFDSVMTKSLPEGYEVEDDYTTDIAPKTSAIIYTKHRIGQTNPYDTLFLEKENERAKKLINFVRRGGVLILATAEIADQNYCKIHSTYGLEDDGVMHTSPKYLSDFDDFVELCRKYKHYPTEAKWAPDGSTFNVQPFMLYCHKMADYYVQDRYTPLLSYFNTDTHLTFTVAYSKRMGKGLIEYVAAPLFFTNYGIADKNASKITSRLLLPVMGRHVVRITGEAEMVQAEPEKNTGVFRYLLSRPALRMALYLAMAVLVIFCIFTARRKMRAIPLPEDVSNSTLEFARYMGTFYFTRHQHSKPVVAKYKSLLKELTDYYGWDTEKMSNHELADGIAGKTGENSEKIIKVIRIVNSTGHGHEIDQKTMMELIDYITQLKKKL